MADDSGLLFLYDLVRLLPVVVGLEMPHSLLLGQVVVESRLLILARALITRVSDFTLGGHLIIVLPAHLTEVQFCL